LLARGWCGSLWSGVLGLALLWILGWAVAGGRCLLAQGQPVWRPRPGQLLDMQPEGRPRSDATAFRQWKVAYRLVERGAQTTLWFAANLEVMDRLESFFTSDVSLSPVEINRAFWGACHSGRLLAARYLHHRGAELNWIPPWGLDAPLDAASTSGNPELVTWLHTLGAKTAAQLRRD